MTEASLAAILTGGQARRMGGRKVTALLGGMPLVEHVYLCVKRVARRVVCVGGEGGLASRGVETIPDAYPGANAMGGIATALEYARETLGGDATVLVAGCDMPFLRVELLAALVALAEETGADAVIPSTGAGFEPLSAVYRARAAHHFADRARRGELRLRDAFFAAGARFVEEEELRRHDPHLVSFRNVNDASDLAGAEAFLAGETEPEKG